MARTNYSRGRDIEYRIVALLEESGHFWTMRSPASKGRFDVTGVGQQIRLIQAKLTRRKPVPSLYKEEMESLLEWCKSNHIPPYISIEWWCWSQDKGSRGWHVWVYNPLLQEFEKVLEKGNKQMLKEVVLKC